MGKVLAALLVLASSRAFADEFDGTHTLSTEERANVELDQDKAHKDIEDRYQDDNSASARAAKHREMQEADSKVLQDHGTDDKAYLEHSMRSSPNDEKELKAKKEEVKSKREADAKAKEEAAKAPKEGAVEVIKGFDEDHPLDVHDDGKGKKAAPATDENGNAAPTVEKGFSEEEMAAKGGGEGGDKSAPAKDTEIAMPPSVEPGTQVIEAPASP